MDGMRHVLFEENRRKNLLVVINAYAPHMGLVAKDDTLAEKFYSDLKLTVDKFKGMDYVITGDFNAKLGKQANSDDCIGSHGRGSRNQNGDFLHQFLSDNQLIAANTFFHHRAFHITTWEGVINKKKVYNQIDYILLQARRKHSMINARSYNVFSVDTDHRLVVTILHRKNDLERGKRTQKRPPEVDRVLTVLKKKKALIRQKLSQTNDPSKIKKMKKQRNRLNMCVKRRIGHLESEALLSEANEIMNAKDNAQAALAIKKILFRRKRKKLELPIEKLTEYFKEAFTMDNNPSWAPSFIKLVTQEEVTLARRQLKNGKAPDGVSAEDLKKEEITTLTSKLNKLIVGRDKVLTEGFLVPVEKPGKDASKPENHRPVILLSAYRKLLSQIILRRINPIIESSISNTQFAYRSGRSTGDIVLAHKYLVAGSLAKGFNRHCVGIDMSKAFDNVLRDKLINILRSKGVPEWDLSLNRLLLTNTTFKFKAGKQQAETFNTNKGVPQGDGLSPKLYIWMKHWENWKKRSRQTALPEIM